MIRILFISCILIPIISFGQVDSVAHYYTFGSIWNDVAYDVKSTTDGGFIVVGSTASSGDGNTDTYLLKLDSVCTRQWSLALGSNNNDVAKAVELTHDNGYIIASITNSFGNGYQVNLQKRDSLGEYVWEKNYGGNDWDFVADIRRTYDNGFVFCGETYNNTNGYSDGWIVKVNQYGDTLWTQTVGGAMPDGFHSIIETSDSSIVTAGYKTTNADSTDAYVVKLDRTGNILWDSLYGGIGFESIHQVIEVSDGNYAMVGASSSGGSDIKDKDHYFLKISTNGNQIFETTFVPTVSNNKHDETYSIFETEAGNFIASGYTETFGAGQKDVHVYAIASWGGWGGFGVTFGHYDSDQTFSSIINSKNRMVFVGETNSYGMGNNDVFVLRLDTVYNTNYNNKFDVTSTEDIAPISVNNLQETKIHCSVFPNPASSLLNIFIPDQSNYYIDFYDLFGRKVYSSLLKNPYNQIDITSFKKQVYTYQIKNDKEIVFSGKLVIH